MRVTTVEKAKKTHLNKQEVEDLIKKKRKEDEKLVKGQFDFIDAQGGFLEFSYRIWPGESIQTFHIDHGEVCELPMGVVRHLNNTKKKVRRINPEIAEKGTQVPSTFERISRVRFTPLEFQ